MNQYTNHEKSFGGLFKDAIRLHHLTLKHTIVCILFITIAKYISILLLALTPNAILQTIIYIISIIVIAYFFSAALLSAHRAFSDKPIKTSNALRSIQKKGKTIFLTLFTYIAGGVVVYFVVKLILFGIEKFITHEMTAVNQGLFLISLIFSLVYIMLFYFSFPISVIDEKPFNKAFYEGALLGEKEKMGILILFLMFGAIILLLTPGMISEYFLSVYHLDALFDFVVLCVTLPLYINLLLLLINNAKLQVVIN